MGPARPLARLARRGRRVLGAALRDPQQRRELPGKAQRAARRELVRVRTQAARRAGARVPLPAVEIPDGPVARPGTRAAVVLDTFSELCLRYEWDQHPLSREGWRAELAEIRPHLLFVESAWNGNDGQWRLAMTGEGAPAQELRELVAHCREAGIPTVFWNKEDPPNYDRFLETARLFDHVWTVDADRIPRYREDLGHDRVGLLPFSAQPRIHNPVQRGSGRDREVAFAGSYFADKHPERREQMHHLLGAALDQGLEIYSRQAGGDRRYAFPRRFRPAVVGSLPYEKMLAASTAYKVFLNVNSVTASPTMCARRLFELSAAQTPVLSGPSAAIEPVFGDTVAVARDEEEADELLRALLQHPELRDRRALLAHRRVFDAHLATHRVAQVLQGVGIDSPPSVPTISAVVPTMRPHTVEHVLRTISTQVHPAVELVLVAHGVEIDTERVRSTARELGVEQVQVVHAAAELTLGAVMNLGIEAAGGQYVAKMDDDNLYGPHYLSDLVRSFSWTDAQVVGKWAHYAHLQASDATLLRFGHAEHRYTDLVQGGTMLIPREVATELRFEDLPRRVDTTFCQKVQRAGGRVYSADRFNFVSVRGASPDAHTWTITDRELLAKRGRLVFFGDPTGHVMV
ncbi:Spore maturation protein CgeB [Kytococcus aerolatus]|uniref:Spore maturation protein CgeB n=1 Tax=Kytococcus aerolatus TaxID=592308 RepID=A0A212TH59_9MICO|nr:glycosyltransferase [Kytococcus aerolatus]SNC65333.1 Spore maturation protein CgeB [Kytococcus aerolatus]